MSLNQIIFWISTGVFFTGLYAVIAETGKVRRIGAAVTVLAALGVVYSAWGLLRERLQTEHASISTASIKTNKGVVTQNQTGGTNIGTQNNYYAPDPELRKELNKLLQQTEKLQSTVDALRTQSQHAENLALKQQALQLSKEILASYEAVPSQEIDNAIEWQSLQLRGIEDRMWHEQHPGVEEQTLRAGEDKFLTEFSNKFGSRIAEMRQTLSAQGQTKWNMSESQATHPSDFRDVLAIAAELADKANQLK